MKGVKITEILQNYDLIMCEIKTNKFETISLLGNNVCDEDLHFVYSLALAYSKDCV